MRLTPLGWNTFAAILAVVFFVVLFTMTGEPSVDRIR